MSLDGTIRVAMFVREETRSHSHLLPFNSHNNCKPLVSRKDKKSSQISKRRTSLTCMKSAMYRRPSAPLASAICGNGARNDSDTPSGLSLRVDAISSTSETSFSPRTHPCRPRTPFCNTHTPYDSVVSIQLFGLINVVLDDHTKSATMNSHQELPPADAILTQEQTGTKILQSSARCLAQSLHLIPIFEQTLGDVHDTLPFLKIDRVWNKPADEKSVEHAVHL